MHDHELLAAARAARLRAYAPYSGFPVGAALRAKTGQVFTGANIENSAYGISLCAERAALSAAVNAGRFEFDKIAIVADHFKPPAPCGACRQALSELAGEIEVIMANLEGKTKVYSLNYLLPETFSMEPGMPAQAEPPASGDPESWRLNVSYSPIGYVASRYNTPEEMPKGYKEQISAIFLRPDLEDGLYRLNEEERILVVAHLHHSQGYALKEERSGRGGEVYGVFSCRTPARPNPLALSRVELVSIEGSKLTVRGLDLINGTPVLDIKTDFR